jgi:hypothetical protein
VIRSQSWQSNLLWTRLSRSAPPRATELFINLKTAAKVLDLTEPNALWVSANEVIE